MVLNLTKRTKSSLIVFCCALLASIFFFACGEESEVGADFLEQESFDVLEIDTLSFEMSTVKFDSIITSSSSRLLVGTFSDGTLGNIKASTAFELVPTTSKLPEKDSTTYLRTFIRLKYDGYYFNDTLVQVKFAFYPLSKSIEYHESGYLYNTSKINIDSTNKLSDFTFSPKLSEKQIEIPLDDNFGKDLYQKAVNNDAIFSDDNKFLEYFKGIAIVPDPISDCFLGFSIESEIVVEYIKDTSKMELTLSGKSLKHYSNITAEGQPNNFDKLYTQKLDLASEESSHLTAMHGGLGYGIKISIPYIKSLYELQGDVFISDATFKLRPVKGTYNKKVPLPKNIVVYQLDKNNKPLEQPINTTIKLVEDVEFGETTYYAIPIGGFINAVLKEAVINDKVSSNVSLFVTFFTEGINADRLIIGDGKNEFKSELELHLIQFDPNSY